MFRLVAQPCGSLVLLAGLLVALATAPPADAQDPSESAATPLLQQLPQIDRCGPDTTSYLYRAAWPTAWQQFAGTPVGNAIESEPIQYFLAEVQRMTRRRDPGARLYELTLTALGSELVMASRPVDPNDAAAAEEPEGEPDPSAPPGIPGPGNSFELPAIAQIAIATSPAAQRDHLADVVRKIAEGWTGEVRRLDDFLVLAQAGMSLMLRQEDNRLLATNAAAGIAWLRADPPQETLAQAPQFRQTLGPLMADRADLPLALYYYDIRPLWRAVNRHTAAAMWQPLSWTSIESFAGATWFEDGHFRTRHYLKLAERRAGLFEHSRQSRVDDEWLRRVPADATMVITGVWDAHSFCVGTTLILMWTSGGLEYTSAAELPGYIQVLQPITRHFGERYLLYAPPRRYGSFPMLNAVPFSHWVAVAQVDDADELIIAIRALVRQGGSDTFTFTTTEWRETEIHTVMAEFVPLYIAAVDDVVIIAMHPQLLKDAVDNWQRPGPSVLDTPAFEEARKHFLPDACFLAYFPPGGFMTAVHDEYVPILQHSLPIALMERRWSSWGNSTGIDSKAAFNPLVIPRGRDLARFERHPTVMTACDDGTGVLFDGVSPVLSTPYWVTHQHLFSRFSNQNPAALVFEIAGWLAAPPRTARPEGDEGWFKLPD